MRIINYVNYNVRSWFAICDGWILICFFVFQGSLLLNVKVWSRVFEKCSKFYLYSSKFFIFLYTETFQLPNPSETQIWKGENESVHRHQHIFLSASVRYYIGCYGNSSLAAAEKPKILKRFLTIICTKVACYLKKKTAVRWFCVHRAS